MNYLALCQRLRQEAGISGTGPSSVESQTGEMGRVVDWITAAYEDIQTAHATWRFLRESFSFSTVIATQEYTQAMAGLSDLATWIDYDIRCYVATTDEQILHFEPWDTFRSVYMFGSNRTSSGRPSVVSIKPNNSLMLWQIPPDTSYTINGEYYKVPDVLSGNTDTPIIPARFHMIIVWKALMLYGAYAAADEKYAHGQAEYRRMMRELEHDQLEKPVYGEPLA